MSAVYPGMLSAGFNREHQGAWDDLITKAYITGSQVVTESADGDASALRPQFLLDNFVNTLYDTDLDITLKRLPIQKVSGPLVEFSRIDQIGSGSDTFVGETGDGSFGVGSGEDAWSRHTKVVKFLAVQRLVGDIAAITNNITDLRKLARHNATLELIRNANVALFWGHSGLNTLQFDGFEKQIMDYVFESGDAGVLIDMNNTTIGIEEIKIGSAIVANRWGKASVLIQSISAHNATEQTVWQQLRGDLRQTGGTQGSINNTFGGVVTQMGTIRLEMDIMLRENRPSVFNGPAGTGAMNTVADTGAWAFNDSSSGTTGPFHVASTFTAAGVAAGTNNYWDNRTLNTQNATPAKPALPSATGTNNAANRLLAGSYYYAIEAVISGRRSVYFALGATTAGTLTGATAMTVTLGQINVICLNAAATVFTSGSYVAAQINQVHFRLYRTAALSAAPTAISQFSLLGTFAFNGAPEARFNDNGMYIPGCTTSFLLTEKRDGRNSVVFAEFRDMTEKMLAPLALASQFVVTLFGTPIVFFGGHHAIYYNVRASDVTAFT